MTKRRLKHRENDIFFEDVDIEDEDLGYAEGIDDYEDGGSDEFGDSDDDGYPEEEPRPHRGRRKNGYAAHKEKDKRDDRPTKGRRSSGEAAFQKGEGFEAAGGKASKGRKNRKKRKKWPFVLLFIIIAIAAVLLYNNFRTGRNWTIAVFGVDSRSTELENGTRSDVIMIVNIDRLTGDVKLCSVFRDTYLKIDEEGTYKKINAAYERGGHEQAIAALEENLDIEIDDYATFSWGTVATAINLMGGLDIEITDAEFRYINAFITETVEATGIGSYQLEHAGWNHLDGVQAVAYGRLRLMDTDFQRTARQRKVLSLMLDKVKVAEKAALINMARVLIGEISTSVGIDDLMPVIGTAARFNIPEGGSSGFPFSRATEDIGSQNYVIPTTLESNVVMLHQFLFGDEDYTAPQSVKDISARISADSGYYEPGQTAPVPEVGGSSGGGTADEPAYEAPAPAETEPETAPPEETAESLEETMDSMGEDESESSGDNGEEDTSDENESSEDSSSEAEGDDSEASEGSESVEDESGEDDEGRPSGESSGSRPGSTGEETGDGGSSGNGASGGAGQGPATPDSTGGASEGGTSSQGPQTPGGGVSGGGPSGGPGSGDSGKDIQESLSQLDKYTPVESAPDTAAAEAGPGT